MLAPRDDTQLKPARPAWAVVIRSFAFVRKEIVEILRQPRLVALLVVGPFLLLLLFGSGYAETDITMRAVFVGPKDSIYEQVLDTYQDELSEYIDSKGLVSTEAEGRKMLADGDVDVVVIFPEHPEQTVMQGERAVIGILHDEIDPIQQGAIEIAARLAIQEVNATVLATLASEAQDQLAPAADLGDELVAAGETLPADPVGTRETLRTTFALLGDVLDGSANILDRIGPDDDPALTQLESTRTEASDLAARVAAVDENTSDAELADLTQSIQSLAGELDDAVVLDPNVLVRPFQAETENVSGADVSPTDYFTPASLALLLQHLALTFAALSIVRDRRTGLFELMRVGPLSSIEIIVGKILAYLLVGSFVGAALVVAAVYGLGISIAGSIGWLAAMMIGVLLASLALGMVFALISKSESQAVQFAMLALLAGLFFSGFILPLDGLTYPVRLISWTLPVTYGIQTLQDVMLRGTVPATEMVAGLGALVAIYGAIAVVGLRRRLRTSEA
jgi:ABC-2 type transport system permease protein